MEVYQQYIHKSKYARFVEKLKRREHFDETIVRYINHMSSHLANNLNFEMPDNLKKDIQSAIRNLEVMPSMRALMSSGRALERDNTAGFNCSYLPVDDPKSFDEAMYILMCGAGVGFSVERQYINKLPEIADQLTDTDTEILVKDSKEGWCKALRQLIAILYSGEIPRWNLDKIRPHGARLKIFGGRASGPEPLELLFKSVVRIFRGAQGRKLNSIECHDIMCFIGQTIVVGGVRRSAMISLSNLSDDRMRNAKSGAWWQGNLQRRISNNSAAHTEKPDVGMFMEEWLALYNSKSGERGIFNREAAKHIAGLNERRNTNFDFGTNPCSEIILRPYQFCNLTEVIARENDTMEILLKKIELATIMGTIQSTLTNFPYLRKIWKKNTEEERLLGVSITGIYDCKILRNHKDKELPDRLKQLKEKAIEINKKWANLLDIEPSAAITCVKPSGNVSQLTNTSSGIHPRFATHYIRRVRNDFADPLAKFLIDSGVPYEEELDNPSSVVFSFPQQGPKGCITRDHVTALDHLKLWLIYQRNYCEHKPSVTINVKEEEWPEVGSWVWEHFDELSGVAFLPYDGGTYQQAPYEKINKKEYNKMIKKIPEFLNWDDLEEFDDNVEGSQELACSAGGCEL